MSPRKYLATVLLLTIGSLAQAGPLDEMATERWSKLREVEFYQLKIAEKYYTAGQWKVAADEYEKFLKLYEKSLGAPYAQLKWSICQVNLRYHNTAIKDGFQSVIDYYPDAPEAVSAAFYIGRAYKDIGNLKLAKQAHTKLLAKHPQHFVSVYARQDLVEIAEKEKEPERRLTLLRELTYDVPRKGPIVTECTHAARQLAQHYFANADFIEGSKALATTCAEASLPDEMMNGHGNVHGIISSLTGAMEDDVKKKGNKLADEAISYMQARTDEALKDPKTKARGVQLWHYVASLQSHARRPEKQREVFEKMLATLGKSDALLENLAQWYWSNGKRDLARETYGKFENAVEGQAKVANCWREDDKNRKVDLAVQIYRQLMLKDDKNKLRWLGEIAWTYRHRAAKAELAIAVYREMIAANPEKTGDYQWEIALTHRQFGQWKEAITAFRATVGLSDNYFLQGYLYMAEANRALKQYDEAITLYKALLSSPSAPSVLWNIGVTHEEAKRPEEAIKTFKVLCDKYPSTGEASNAHRHLNDTYKISVTLGGKKD